MGHTLFIDKAFLGVCCIASWCYLVSGIVNHRSGPRATAGRRSASRIVDQSWLPVPCCGVHNDLVQNLLRTIVVSSFQSDPSVLKRMVED